MNNETKFKVGSAWKTRGGQRVTVIHIYKNGDVLSITDGETLVLTRGDGRHHSASENDLVAPWIDRPELPPGVAWPKWAKAFSQSSTGNWHWWDQTPSQVDNVWHSVNGTHCIRMHPTETPQWTGDWSESLVVRDGGE